MPAQHVVVKGSEQPRGCALVKEAEAPTTFGEKSHQSLLCPGCAKPAPPGASEEMFRSRMSTRQRGPAVSFPAERTDYKKPSLRCWGRTNPTFPSNAVSPSPALGEAGWEQVSDKKLNWCLFTCQRCFYFAVVSEHPELPEKQHLIAQDIEQNTPWLSCLRVTPASPISHTSSPVSGHGPGSKTPICSPPAFEHKFTSNALIRLLLSFSRLYEPVDNLCCCTASFPVDKASPSLLGSSI